MINKKKKRFNSILRKGLLDISYKRATSLIEAWTVYQVWESKISARIWLDVEPDDALTR